LGLIEQIRHLLTLRMHASGLVFIRVGLAQQQVDFDHPKVRAVVRATIHIHRATVRIHRAVCLHLRNCKRCGGEDPN
jgi:hypothetical protein